MTHDDPIYLDHNATTPLLPDVVDAMLPYLREHFGNPSSGHVYGTRARGAVVRAREQVATLLGCDVDEVVFTSGGTEANNLAIRGVAEVLEGRSHIVTTVIEHPATARPCAWLQEHERSVTRVGVDADGRTRLDQAREAIDGDTALVTVMHSNNETGVLQPVAELAQLAHASGALLHTDAAQSIGKVPVRVRDLGVDLLSIAGHKLYAPKGVGALYVKRGTPLVPFVLGATMSAGSGRVPRTSPPSSGSAPRAKRWGVISKRQPHGCTRSAIRYGRASLPTCQGSRSTDIARFGCRTRSTCASLRLPGARCSLGPPRWRPPRARRATKVTRVPPRSSSRWASPRKTPSARCGSRWDAARRQPMSCVPPRRWFDRGEDVRSNSRFWREPAIRP
jgi:hypothetical protein